MISVPLHKKETIPFRVWLLLLTEQLTLRVALFCPDIWFSVSQEGLLFTSQGLFD